MRQFGWQKREGRGEHPRVPAEAERGHSGVQSQLWQLLLDPAGSGYYVIQNLLFGYVIDIAGNSAQPGAGLDSYVLKLTGNTNQLWEAAGGAFPPAVQTASPPPAVGGAWQWVL
jgi:hypothetical protein